MTYRYQKNPMFHSRLKTFPLKFICAEAQKCVLVSVRITQEVLFVRVWAGGVEILAIPYPGWATGGEAQLPDRWEA